MFETFVGLFALALGWMCFDHVAKVRALYSEARPPHSRFHGEKPLMIVPSVLGALFVAHGLALLTPAAVERLRDADMVGSSGMFVALALIHVSIAALVLPPRLTGRRRRRGRLRINVPNPPWGYAKHN